MKAYIADRYHIEGSPYMPCYVALLAAGALVWGVLGLTGGGRSVARASVPAVGPLTAAWTTFQQDCTEGPSPGQGSAPSACVCWERNLQAVDILPAYAVDVLNAAQAGGSGEAFTVAENLGNLAVSEATQGCDLYAQAANE